MASISRDLSPTTATLEREAERQYDTEEEYDDMSRLGSDESDDETEREEDEEQKEPEDEKQCSLCLLGIKYSKTGNPQPTGEFCTCKCGRLRQLELELQILMQMQEEFQLQDAEEAQTETKKVKSAGKTAQSSREQVLDPSRTIAKKASKEVACENKVAKQRATQQER